MQIVDAHALSGRPVTRFGSVGFTARGLARGDALHVGVLRLEPGGCIGRHPTVQRQILLVLEGDASVSGAVGQHPIDLAPGQAAMWDPGESHETRSRTGMTALTIEGDFEHV